MIAKTSEAETLRREIAELQRRLHAIEQPAYRQSREPRCFGYTRVSTEEQGRGTSLQVQESGIREFHAARYSAMPYGATLVDDGISAYKVALFRRPQGGVLQQILQSGDVLVFWNIDRAFRNMRDCVNSLHWLNERGIRVIFMDQPDLELDSMIGKLIVTILAWAAEFASRRSSERMKASYAYRRQRGLRAGSPGWGRTYTKTATPSLAWDQFELDLIAEIVRLRRTGLSHEKISWLIEEELCRRDGRHNLNTLIYRSPNHKFTRVNGRTWLYPRIRDILKQLEVDKELAARVAQAKNEIFRVTK